jgi:hypothetical protein
VLWREREREREREKGQKREADCPSSPFFFSAVFFFYGFR